MRARSLMSIVAAAGIALAATACGSDDGGSGDNGAAGTHNESSVEQTSRAAAPAQSAQDLLLDAGEFPAGTGFSLNDRSQGAPMQRWERFLPTVRMHLRTPGLSGSCWLQWA